MILMMTLISQALAGDNLDSQGDQRPEVKVEQNLDQSGSLASNWYYATQTKREKERERARSHSNVSGSEESL